MHRLFQPGHHRPHGGAGPAIPLCGIDRVFVTEHQAQIQRINTDPASCPAQRPLHGLPHGAQRITNIRKSQVEIRLFLLLGFLFSLRRFLLRFFLFGLFLRRRNDLHFHRADAGGNTQFLPKAGLHADTQAQDQDDDAHNNAQNDPSGQRVSSFRNGGIR